MRRHDDAEPPGNPEDGSPGDPEDVARIICLRMLDRRACTRAELAAAVHRRGVPDDAAQRVLDRLTAVNLIDDAALADGFALAQHQERGLAARSVALKLRRRGVDDETVRVAIGQIDRESEAEQARRLAERRLRSLSSLAPEVQARRLVGLLARKGYAPGLAHDTVRAVLRDAADADAGDDADLGSGLGTGLDAVDVDPDALD